jgi:hypothetical protein
MSTVFRGRFARTCVQRVLALAGGEFRVGQRVLVRFAR